VGPLQDVDRIDLEQPEPPDDRVDVASGDARCRARATESLRGQGDPPSLELGQPSHERDGIAVH
jgi:hypothetical protein